MKIQTKITHMANMVLMKIASGGTWETTFLRNISENFRQMGGQTLQNIVWSISMRLLIHVRITLANAAAHVSNRLHSFLQLWLVPSGIEMRLKMLISNLLQLNWFLVARVVYQWIYVSIVFDKLCWQHDCQSNALRHLVIVLKAFNSTESILCIYF